VDGELSSCFRVSTNDNDDYDDGYRTRMTRIQRIPTDTTTKEKRG